MRPAGQALVVITCAAGLIVGAMTIIYLAPSIETAGSATGSVLSDPAHASLSARLSAEANQLARSSILLLRWQAVVTAIGVMTGAATLVSAIAAALYARRAALESGRSADIARDSLVASERAWLNVEVIALGPLRFHPLGDVDILIGIEISNVGRTPALNVHTSAEMILDHREAPAVVERLARESRTLNKTWSRLLLPGQKYLRKWGPSAHLAEKDTLILPVIVGVVTYQITPDASLHQTAFAVTLAQQRKQDSGPALIARRRPVPIEELVIEGTTGGFAD